MKFFIFNFFFVLSLSAYDSFYSQKINMLESEQLKVATHHFEDLVAKALVSRANIKRFVKESQLVSVLSGSQIEALQKGIVKQIYLREDFYRIINNYKNYPFTNEEETLLTMDNRLKGGLLALASASVLFDNYLLSLAEVQDSAVLRRLINKGDGTLRSKTQKLQLVVDSFNSREKRKKFRLALDWFLKHRQKLSSLAKSDPQLKIISDVIKSSASVRVLGKGNLFSDYFKGIVSDSGKIGDKFVNLSSSSMNRMSKFFGNSVGSVQFRKGLLYGDKQTESKIISQLKPLDVLLEKTPFRLTDKFIPGHFGHVAIWLGSESQLKAANLWDDPLITPYHEEIRNGHCVLEALRDGVQLNSMAHFLDVDDVAVLRKSVAGDKRCILRACQQIGKEYDFNFDVETLDKIVCSELVYHVFVDEKWPTTKTLGRHTISPDNVAVKVLDGSFTMEFFVHKGNVSSLEKYKELLNKK